MYIPIDLIAKAAAIIILVHSCVLYYIIGLKGGLIKKEWVALLSAILIKIAPIASIILVAYLFGG